MDLAPEVKEFSYLIGLSFVFWILIYIRTSFTSKGKDHFASNAFWLSTHSLGAVLFGTLSLFFGDGSKFPEVIVISWGIGFFLLDTFDCIKRVDIPFLIHGVLGLTFLYMTTWSQFYPLRVASKGYFVELSTPFYHRWRKQKTKKTLGDFAISFMLSRIIWLPIFLYQTFSVTGYNKFAVVGASLFYLLNLAWFLKGLKLYFSYRTDYEKKKDD